nr:glycosyltransferase [uncultured Sellimonas sp.]
MKILMINVVCGIRSTGRICTDLATSLEAEGHEVKIAYGREYVPEQYRKYAVRIGSDIDVNFHGLKARLSDADGLGSKIATREFLKWVDKFNPDIIHLHNLHGYYINVPLLFDYINTRNKRIIWTLHDMWSFTGHSGTCDMYNCEKWKLGCGNCPARREYPASFRDKSARNYIWKKKIFSRVQDMTIVTPSRWLAGLVKQSFLKDKKIEVIPNGIDIKQFKPLENDFKEFYGIQNKILLLGCTTSWGKGKGLYDFYTLAEKLDDRFKVVLVGLNKNQISALPNSILGIERTNSVKELAQMYSAADIFINLTHADNYPTVNLEALACGTPVITYKTGGSDECLDGNNGRYFEKGDIDSIIKFLRFEYSSDMFKVSHSNGLDKRITTQAYLGYLSGGGYFETRHRYHMTGKNVVLGVAAKWDKRKGLETFIRLANELSDDYKIIMVGVTQDIKDILPKRVVTCEKTDSQEELRRLYSASDVFLNPTLQDNYPTVNLEASACGTPVITYDTGGSPESANTPSCVVEQGDFKTLKQLITDKVFEDALRVENIKLLGKEYMSVSYRRVYSS